MYAQQSSGSGTMPGIQLIFVNGMNSVAFVKKKKMPLRCPLSQLNSGSGGFS